MAPKSGFRMSKVRQKIRWEVADPEVNGEGGNIVIVGAEKAFMPHEAVILHVDTAGANGGSNRVPGAKNIIFSKSDPGPLGMLKQVFFAHFEHVVTHFGPWKIPK